MGLFAGPFAAGILLTHSSSASVFAVFAVVTMLGAVLVARLRLDPDATPPKEPIVAGDVLRET